MRPIFVDYKSVLKLMAKNSNIYHDSSLYEMESLLGAPFKLSLTFDTHGMSRVDSVPFFRWRDGTRVSFHKYACF
jgi:hypothetical protein